MLVPFPKGKIDSEVCAGRRERGKGQLVLQDKKWQQKAENKVINRSFSRREGGFYCA